MELTINSNTIDFTLENEKTLQEVIIQVSNFLKNSYMVIEKLYVNSEDFSDKSIDIPLEGIEKVDIETTSLFEIKLNNIEIVLPFFIKLKEIVNSWSKSESEKVEKEIGHVYTILSETLSHNNLSLDETFSNALKDLFNRSTFFANNFTEGYTKEFNKFIDNLMILLLERKSEILNPKDELLSSIKLLEDLSSSLEEVSILLQTNKEAEASDIINKFVSLFQKVIRLIEINQIDDKLIEEEKLGSFINELNDILNELLEGFESQDVVLIGDILEYEVTPKIEYLHNLIVKGQ